MGDPAGIGPEIIVKALHRHKIRERVCPVVVGSVPILKQASALVGGMLPIEAVGKSLGEQWRTDQIRVLDPHRYEVVAVQPGVRDAFYGRMAIESVESALSLVLSGQAKALVTAPICKESAHLAGFNFPGLTEFLADRCGVRQAKLFLWSPLLKVIHATGHTSLRNALRELTVSNIIRTAELGREIWRKVYQREPQIAIAALNPHAGEGGAFGQEDERLVLPAVERMKAQGFKVDGPVPADTVFYKARKRMYDLVVALYHDQGHIPVKLLAFDRAVNVTAGLPIVRTAPDHGVAFDIAWQNKARDFSLVEAILLAARLAAAQNRTGR